MNLLRLNLDRLPPIPKPTPMSFIENLRKKPEETRERILWISVVLVAIILVSIWIWQIKNSVSRAEKVLSNSDFRENVSKPFKEFKETSGSILKQMRELNKNLEKLQEGETEKK